MSGIQSTEQFLSGSPRKRLIKCELVIYPTKYNGNGDGQNFYSWMRILSHEVGHLKHIEESGGMLKYGFSFLWDYAKNFGHDNVPREKEAEKGRTMFDNFN